jgi:glycosyltransferase involved in cell wall biosynthesis
MISTYKKIIIYYAGFIRFGGVFSHVKALENELIRNNREVTVITLDNLPIIIRYVPHTIEKLINFFNMPMGFHYKGMVTKFFYKKLYNKKNFDLIIFEDIYISWNSNTPSITMLHAVWSDNLQAYSINLENLNRLKNIECNLINKINHNIATVSEPYLEYIENIHFQRKLTKKIQVILLGIDQNIFQKRTQINYKKILYVGALEARKNVLFLLKIFKKLKEIDKEYELTIIGDGPSKEELINFAINNNLKVNFLGSLNHEQVIRELYNHGLYLHTSTKESFSYSLLEAKLAGLRTCANKELQVPPEFIDIAIDSNDEVEWSNIIVNYKNKENNFDSTKYTIQKMVENTLELSA